jgi:hypothetical protein
MTKPTKFIHISRVICPKTRIHYLDAIDENGFHWTAQMSHNIENWIVFTEPWKRIG